MIHDTIVVLAALGVAAEALVAAALVLGIAWAAGGTRPLRAARSLLWGYELWTAFVVAALGTGGSLFFSEVAGFVPCELCWFQRICMYPLSTVLLLAATTGEFRIARYVLALPIVGAGISVYHLLVENGVVAESTSCQVSAPGGCAVKWINEFGYMTIPTLALSGFLLLIVLLVFAVAGDSDTASVSSDDER